MTSLFPLQRQSVSIIVASEFCISVLHIEVKQDMFPCRDRPVSHFAAEHVPLISKNHRRDGISSIGG
jgi:hypothetical protein